MEQTRADGRGSSTPRPITVTTGFQRFPEGSVLYRCGHTTVLIAASVEESVPRWMKGKGKGWVTAEYEMHPRCNPNRQRRARTRPTLDGRSSEIQRLIGRSLRAAVRMDKLGERMVSVDCDVLDADGGTRTASITGGFVALAMALDQLRKHGHVGPGILREEVAVISVGMVEGKHLVDLNYEEDFAAAVDLNVVGTANGGIVEVQGTAEGAPIPRSDFDALLEMAAGAMPTLVKAQQHALEEVGVDLAKLMG
ncbi:MAG TPA: ribonuclease PH [Sandaracinaceae bacterium LLY-WYZ-13_1]|nr:ribonuclease PH [Sandaracinaceae bacterium LLY-WYZ-13_1]